MAIRSEHTLLTTTGGPECTLAGTQQREGQRPSAATALYGNRLGWVPAHPNRYIGPRRPRPAPGPAKVFAANPPL